MKVHGLTLLAGVIIIGGPAAVLANPWPKPTPAPTPAPLMMGVENLDTIPYALEKRNEFQKRQNCVQRCNSTACCTAGQECYTMGGQYRCRVAGLGDLSSAMDDLSSLLSGSEFAWLTATNRNNPYTNLFTDNGQFNRELSSIMAQYTAGVAGNTNYNQQAAAVSSIIAAAATATDISDLDRSISDPAFTLGSSGEVKKKKSNVGAIAGGVVGGVVAIALIVGIVWFIMRRKRKAKLAAEAAAAGTTGTTGAPAAAPANTNYNNQYASVVPEKPPPSPGQGGFAPVAVPPPSVSPMSATGQGYYQPPPGSPPPQLGQQQQPPPQQYQQQPQQNYQQQPHQNYQQQPGPQYFNNPPPPPPVASVPEPPPGTSELPQEGVPIQQQQGVVGPQYGGQNIPQGGGVQQQWTGSTVTGSGGQAPSEVHGESVYQHPGQSQGHNYYEMDANNNPVAGRR